MGLTIVAGVLIAAVLLAGFVLPKHVYVARRIVIDAPVELVWPDVGNLSTWPEWTEWSPKNDPSYDPKPEGTNKLVWTQSQAGSGEQVITESDPAKGIKYRIELQGGRYQVEGRVQLTKDGTRTAVTWIDSMDYAHSYLGRYMGSMMDMMLGPMVERSLLALKVRAEERAKDKGVVALPAPQLPDPALTPPPAEPKGDAQKPDEVKPDEPRPAEPPKPVEPKADEPKPVEPKPAEPVKAEPPKPEPVKPEPAKPPEEAKPEEPKQAEPPKAEEPKPAEEAQ